MLDDIEFEELTKQRDQFVLYDVRNAEEVEATGHIPDVRNLPLNEVEEALKMDEKSFTDKYGFEKPKKNQVSVIHCQKGGRARKAGELMAAQGYSVRVYAGSFNDWKAKGGDILPGKP